MNTNQKIIGRLRLLAARVEGVREFSVFSPSSEAVEAELATRKYNSWIVKQKNWKQSIGTQREQALAGAMAASMKKVHQRGLDNQTIFPWGKKHQQWKQYNADMDWLDAQMAKH